MKSGQPEHRVGNYRIITGDRTRRYEAPYIPCRREDFHQRVALKVIKRGMDTDAVLKRFVRERQILAELIDPNIKASLTAGRPTTGCRIL